MLTMPTPKLQTAAIALVMRVIVRKTATVPVFEQFAPGRWKRAA